MLGILTATDDKSGNPDVSSYLEELFSVFNPVNDNFHIRIVSVWMNQFETLGIFKPTVLDFLKVA